MSAVAAAHVVNGFFVWRCCGTELSLLRQRVCVTEV